MKPADLKPDSFASYPAESRALAQHYLPLFQQMPLVVLPSYLAQLQNFPSLFPVEQLRLKSQLDALQARPALLEDFAAIRLPAEMEQKDWVRQPALFENALSAALWQTRQIDAFHKAGEQLFAVLPGPARAHDLPPPMLMAVIGQGTGQGMGRGMARDASGKHAAGQVDSAEYPLFTRLRSQGLYARKVDETDAPQLLVNALQARAEAHALPYAHWYVDGGTAWHTTGAGGQSGVQQFTFPSLAPVTDVVLREMDRAVREGSGPEVLVDRLRLLRPDELGLSAVTGDPRMARFFVTLLTQGSGTQLYSTSFVQAAGVELVRRAEPQTLMLRFAPRRRPANMNDMLEQRAQSDDLDAEGALVDADMAVYYAWLAMQSQPGGEQASLLVYVEGHGEVFVAGPGVTRGVETQSPMNMKQVLALLS